eukprot:SAG22_NODE_958_length_6301_cov_4.995324_9_plen_74_part_00
MRVHASSLCTAVFPSVVYLCRRPLLAAPPLPPSQQRTCCLLPAFQGKSFDTFCPIGPYIVTVREVQYSEPGTC